MDRLPQELVIHIDSFLEREDGQSDIGLLQRKKTVSYLPPYATLSPKWQLVTEYRTVLTGHQRDMLSYLSYDVLLPTYTVNEFAKFETEKDMKRNSQAFTDAVYALFQTLRAWDADGPAKESRSLFLDISDIYSPMDGRHRGFDKYQEDAELYESGKRDNLWHHR